MIACHKRAHAQYILRLGPWPARQAACLMHDFIACPILPDSSAKCITRAVSYETLPIIYPLSLRSIIPYVSVGLWRGFVFSRPATSRAMRAINAVFQNDFWDIRYKASYACCRLKLRTLNWCDLLTSTYLRKGLEPYSWIHIIGNNQFMIVLLQL